MAFLDVTCEHEVLVGFSVRMRWLERHKWESDANKANSSQVDYYKV